MEAKFAEKAALVGFLEALHAERMDGASPKTTDDSLSLLIEVLNGRAKVERLPAGSRRGQEEPEGRPRTSGGGGGLFDFAESLLDGIDALGGKATTCRAGKHTFKCLHCGETVHSKASES